MSSKLNRRVVSFVDVWLREFYKTTCRNGNVFVTAVRVDNIR